MSPRLNAPRLAYEHPWFVRVIHWTNAVAVVVMTMSGLQIFWAFPSFGAKIPQQNLLDEIPKAIRLGGWLGGALQWHFTFMWIFAGGGLLYVVLQLTSRHCRTIVFTPRDLPGVWPMARHYFLRKPEPQWSGQYNPLQKLAYTSAIGLGALLLLTGAFMYKPTQLSFIGVLFGGFDGARVLHFGAMVGLLAFIPGHLIMVALHGWNNLQSIFTGWTVNTKVTGGQRCDE